VNGFNVVSQQFIVIYHSGCKTYCTGPDSSRFFKVPVHEQFHAVDKHVTTPSHIILTLGQAVLLYHFNGQR